MMSKLHNNEKEKNKESEIKMEKTTPYKHKGRKLEFFKHEDESSSEESTKHNTEKHKDFTKSSESNQKKNNYKPYE